MTTNWQQPPGGPPPPQPNNQNKGKRFALIAVLLVVIAGLAAGAGLFMANQDADIAGEDARYVVTETVSTEPVFELANAPGHDSFFELDLQLAAFQAEQEEEILAEAEELLEGAEPGQQVEVPEFDVAALDEAVKTGLYGGTVENTCDPERLISFLYANPHIGQAWATVQGIEFLEIADYIRSLDQRILAADVRVSNYGYDEKNNAPYEIDTILEAGTAVLVDENGDVRTRCYCGNPIKPRPPQHMPPRCVVLLEHVYVAPGGGERRANAVRDVLLTGRESTVGGATWVEVKWGNNDNERGWVRSDNLRKHYCPPKQAEWECPGPGAVPVWENPDETVQVGWHTGTLNTPLGNTDIFGPVEPVGGLNPVINNGFMLVHFKQAGNLQNSAWVRLDDLDQDEENCFRIPMCVDTQGPVWERVDGAVDSAGGVMRVEFTGRFVVDAPITHAEVRLIEEDGRNAWISILYTPLAEEDCGGVPEYECVTDYDKFAPFVYTNSTGGDHIGHVSNAIVTVLGPVQDGRVRINMVDPATPFGPIGWIDEAALTADIAECVPVYQCYITTGPAFADFPTNGLMIGAIGAPKMIGKVGKHVHDMPGDPAHYERIEVDGLRYWIDDADLIPVALEDCYDTIPCPTYGWPEGGRDVPPRAETIAELRLTGELEGLRMIDEGDLDDDGRPDRPVTSECCVTALFETPDVSTPVIAIPYPAIVTVFGSITVDNGGVDEVWFITTDGDFFMAIHVIPGFDCLGDCPDPVRVPGIRDALAMELPESLRNARVTEELIYLPEPDPGADCCISAAYTEIESGIETPGGFPRLVEVQSGPHAPAPGWYLTTDGDWFSANHVVPASLCDPVECPNPMVPGLYDLDALKRSGDETTLALTFLYPGDTAECCAEGELYSSASADDPTGGVLGEPTTVIVVDIDGDWYQVQVDDMVVWIHVSQFVDLGECDGDVDVCDVNANDWERPEVFDTTVSCCIQGRALTVHPADADGGDAIEIDPAVEGIMFEYIDDLGTGPWYGFITAEHGTVWVPADSIVDASECDRVVDCPGDSKIGSVDVGGVELVQCCVAFTTAAGGPGYKVVTLTGETDEVAGVTTYYTTDGETYIDADFVSVTFCEELTCDDGRVVLSLSECLPPTYTCENGQIVTNPNACPPTDILCPDGVTVVQDRSQCPPPPAGCDDTDGDGWCDEADNCVFNANPGQEDFDGDGRGNECDDCPTGDTDGDRICDDQDNCVETRNNNQRNRDGDGVGDACDNCPDVTNGFQFDDDGDGIGNECDKPDCPADRTTSDGQCCPAGSSADGPECFCASGPEVFPGGECPPPCPVERQIPGGPCCPAGTTAGSVDCFCADGSLSVPGAPCTKECPNGERIPQDGTCAPFGEIVLPEGCPSDRLRGDGVCCPKGTIAWQTNLSSAIVWNCLEPEG